MYNGLGENGQPSTKGKQLGAKFWGLEDASSKKASLLGGCLWPRSAERIYYQRGWGIRVRRWRGNKGLQVRSRNRGRKPEWGRPWGSLPRDRYLTRALLKYFSFRKIWSRLLKCLFQSRVYIETLDTLNWSEWTRLQGHRHSFSCTSWSSLIFYLELQSDWEEIVYYST